MPKSDRNGIHIGIDASNIRQGGGVTHLIQLLKAVNPPASGIDRITVWTNSETAKSLPDYPWLDIKTSDWLNRILPFRMLYQQLFLMPNMKSSGCDILFSPGGTLPAYCPLPSVTMSQNMLPFEDMQARKFGKFSLMYFKLKILKYSQSRSFKKADGVIFLSQYAKDEIESVVGKLNRVALIPHGIEQRFYQKTRTQKNSSDLSPEDPIRLLYVSILMPYKHQYEIARAVSNLRSRGLAVEMTFIGGAWGSYGTDFEAFIRKLDPNQDFLFWLGALPFDEVHRSYGEADIFIFGSSCENLPNILIEAMAAGLPVVSSNKGPMPEVLGDSGMYFDPEDVSSIERAISDMVENDSVRFQMARIAQDRARNYSWATCADKTFEFLNNVYEDSHG